MGNKISKSDITNSLFQLIVDFIGEVNIAEKKYNYDLQNKNIVKTDFTNIIWNNFGPYSGEIDSLYFKYERELDYFINKHAIPNIKNTINAIKLMQKIKVNYYRKNKIDHSVFINCDDLINRFKCNPYLNYEYNEKEFVRNSMNLSPVNSNKCDFYIYRKENFARISTNELEDYLKLDDSSARKNDIINYAKKELKSDNYYSYSSINSKYSKYIYIKGINKIIDEFKLSLHVNAEEYNKK